MDINISGKGSISAGEYETVKVSGSGKLEGPISCGRLHVSGAAQGKSITCKGEVHVSGSCSFAEDIAANSASVSGALKCRSIRTDTWLVADSSPMFIMRGHVLSGEMRSQLQHKP